MTDTITLPREVGEYLMLVLEMVEPYADQLTDYSSTAAEWPLNLLPKKVGVAITALRTALAAPRLEVTVDPRLTKEEAAAISSALAAEQPKHPGYIIGSHWLETAYSRICAGEAEADVLRDIGLVREEAFLTGVAHLKAENEALRRDAERYREQKERSYRLQRLLKECVKVMQANAVFRDTKAHKDLKTRIRAELEGKR